MVNVLTQLKNWDSKSDVILIVDTDEGVKIKHCPADALRKVLGQYREFIECHEMVLETEATDKHLIVSCRWAKKS